MYKNKINLKKTYLNGLKLLLELTVLVLFIYIIPTILKKLILINGTLKIAFGYLFVAFPYLILRYVVSLFYEPYPTQHINERITVIVPFYNEDKKNLLNCARSLLNQARKPDEIFFIDDGSKTIQQFNALKKFLLSQLNTKTNQSTRIVLIRLKSNMGKRRAFYEAFNLSSGDIILTCDSDTIYPKNFIQNLISPFSDPNVIAVTGRLKCRNYKKNFLTKIYETRLKNAYLVERAFQSKLGSVLVCSGPCSAYRRDVIEKYKYDFIFQKFLGKMQTYGDDRALTNFCLKEGKVVYQSTAIAYTLSPEKLTHFIKQQIRWSRSFIRETIITILDVGLKKKKVVPFALASLELSLVILFGLSFLLVLIFFPKTAKATIAGYYFIILLLNSMGRNIRLWTSEENRYFILFSPLLGLLYLLLIYPLRIYALLTIRNQSWVSR